jgi:hypothetical protein
VAMWCGLTCIVVVDEDEVNVKWCSVLGGGSERKPV